MRLLQVSAALVATWALAGAACSDDDAKRRAPDDAGEGGAGGVEPGPGGAGPRPSAGSAGSAGSADGGAGGGEALGIDLLKYCSGAAEQYYSWLAQCYGSSQYPESDRAPFVADTLERCLASEASVEAGRLGFDGVAAADCLAALEGADCEGYRFLEEEPACSAIFAARVAVGDECYPAATQHFSVSGARSECVQGFCDTSGGVCPGECVALKADDEPCSASAECQPDSYCAETCAPRLADGEPCVAGDSCQLGSSCVTALGASDGTCLARSESGAPCSEVEPCVGFDCIAGECRSKVDSGEPCVSYLNCPDGERCLPRDGGDPSCGPAGGAGVACAGPADCDAEHYCPTVGEPQCTARGQVDDACDGSGRCAAGAWCNLETSTCQATGEAGDACLQFGAPAQGSDVCAAGLLCMSNGECRPAGGKAGDPCNTSVASSCEGELFCSREDFTCQPLAGQGALCNPFSPAPCAGELGCLCSDPSCTNYGGSPQASDALHTCEPRRADGDPCFSDAECQVGAQCFGEPRVCTALVECVPE